MSKPKSKVSTASNYVRTPTPVVFKTDFMDEVKMVVLGDTVSRNMNQYFKILGFQRNGC